MNPIVSVIMPCYNEEENVRNAVTCVLQQTFQNFELIIVDDCSTDATAAIVASFADSRICLLRNAENMGVAKSLNAGLKIARGRYIARMDADDTCEPTRLEKQVAYMEQHPECVLCATGADVYNGKEIRLQSVIMGDELLKRYLVKNNPFVHSSVVFRRNISDRTVCYPEVKGFEDYTLWIELSKLGTFHVLPEILVHRVDIDNLGKKRTWAGFNKNKIYRRLFLQQISAIKATHQYAFGLVALVPTLAKIAISFILRW